MRHVEGPLREIDHLHIRLYAAANMRIDQSWSAEDVCSTYWRFYVNSHNGASALLADGAYPLTAHRIHFIPAWVRWTCHNVRPIEHLFAHFDLVGLSGPVVRACFSGPVTLPMDRQLEQECDDLRPLFRHRGAAKDPALACRFKSVLFAAVGQLFAGLAPERAIRLSQYARQPNPVGQAVQYIDDHLDEPLSNPLLAGRCGFATDHFARLFRQHVGQTPAQYVLERRIAVAAEQLVFTDQSIDRISTACGFPDRFYFSRMFKRRMGLPPATYRRTSQV